SRNQPRTTCRPSSGTCIMSDLRARCVLLLLLIAPVITVCQAERGAPNKAIGDQRSACTVLSAVRLTIELQPDSGIRTRLPLDPHPRLHSSARSESANREPRGGAIHSRR